jgi:hypothetical protein
MDGPPISSHARTIPIKKQTITSTAMPFAAPAFVAREP